MDVGVVSVVSSSLVAIAGVAMHVLDGSRRDERNRRTALDVEERKAVADYLAEANSQHVTRVAMSFHPQGHPAGVTARSTALHRLWVRADLVSRFEVREALHAHIQAVVGSEAAVAHYLETGADEGGLEVAVALERLWAFEVAERVSVASEEVRVSRAGHMPIGVDHEDYSRTWAADLEPFDALKVAERYFEIDSPVLGRPTP